MKKKCAKCGDIKLLKFFHKKNSVKDGHAPDCKECVKKSRLIFYNENKDRLLKKKVKYYINNKGDIKKKRKDYRKNNLKKIRLINNKSYKKNSEKYKENSKTY